MKNPNPIERAQAELAPLHECRAAAQASLEVKRQAVTRAAETHARKQAILEQAKAASECASVDTAIERLRAVQDAQAVEQAAKRAHDEALSARNDAESDLKGAEARIVAKIEQLTQQYYQQPIDDRILELVDQIEAIRPESSIQYGRGVRIDTPVNELNGLTPNRLTKARAVLEALDTVNDGMHVRNDQQGRNHPVFLKAAAKRDAFIRALIAGAQPTDAATAAA